MSPVPPMRERAAAVVLAYHPSDGIVRNVELILDQVGRAYIVNNSPDAATESVIRALRQRTDVTVLDQSSNVGVAAGFNIGMTAALAEGFDLVWIFDQDSTVAPGMLETLVGALATQGDDAGIVGPALRAAETGFVYHRERGSGIASRDVLISSGALFSRRVLESVGLHDEGLFIDYVDHDISLRARTRGFVNLKAFDTTLDHRFGDSASARLFGRTVYLSNYSPLRQYYMARNRIVLVRRYGLGPWFWEDLGYLWRAWTKVLLLERGRPAKIRAALSGFRDGWRYPRDTGTGVRADAS